MISDRLRARVLLAIGLALLVGLPAPAVAKSAGQVLFAIGEVSVRDSAGGTRAVSKGDAVASGDTLITGKGRAQIRLSDGGRVALNPQTEYTIEDYELSEEEPSASRSFFNLVRGGVRLVTGRIARLNRKNWRMRTSIATIGIRGSSGHFRYTDNGLRISVDAGGFTAEDNVTGVIGELGPGDYLCSSPCKPVDGAGAPDDPGAVVFEEEPPPDTYETGEELLADGAEQEILGAEEALAADPIPAGPAPVGAHSSVAFPFIDTGGFLNSLADGATIDNLQNFGEFGSLESFEWFTGFPCESCQFNANGGTEVVDPAPDGSLVNTDYSAEWGRVTDNWTVVDGFGAVVQERGHFAWVATLDETPDSELPSSGVLIYDQDVGGTLAAFTYGLAGDTEVADVRTYVRIEVDYGNMGNVDRFLVEVAPPGQAHPDNPSPGTFPSGSWFRLDAMNPGVQVQNGFLFFNSAISQIVVPSGSQPDLVAGGGGMCNAGCMFFGSAVFGPAGLAADDRAAYAVTGAFQGNTAQPSYPPFSVNGAFIVEKR